MPLRLLHTSDWHLGHTLHGVERVEEHAKFLAWLGDTVEREDVDALLVAGDVFECSNPPAAAVAAWFDFLAAVHRRRPHLQLVVVGGNHDSASRLDAPDRILRALAPFHVVGGLPRRALRQAQDERTIDFDRVLVPLRDRDGEVRALAAAVPFLRAADLPGGALEDPAGAVRGIYTAVLEEAERRRAPDQALVALGHLYLAGGEISALSERKILGGDQHALPVDVFADGWAYVALGHLHRAQTVGGRERVRYAGSPLPLSFTERDYAHQVVLVALDGARAAEIRAIPVPRAVELVRLPAEGPKPLDAVLEAIRRLPPADLTPAHEWPFLEVQVALDRPEPGLRPAVAEEVRGKRVRLVRIASVLQGTNRSLGDVEVRRTLADLLPEEVFRRRWERDHEGAPPAELLAAFHELVDAIHRGDEP
jgi:DNA repair protein SbcD/Mre11